MENSSKTSVFGFGNLTILSLLFIGFLYLFCYSSPNSFSTPLFPYFQSSSRADRCPQPQSAGAGAGAEYRTIKFPIDELQEALEKASNPNKTVIIAVVNRAYAEQGVKADTTMLDIFLESFWLGEDTRQLIDHLLIVAADQTAYDRCKFKGLHCYKMETEGVDFGREKIYMSQDFVKMMWRRTLLLLDVLKHGYSFIFTDTDVVWLRNPFPRLSSNESVDIQLSTDWFNGDPVSEKNAINTGFYYIRSNNKTIALFEEWYGRKDNSTGKKEQDVLVGILNEGLLGQMGINPRFLDTNQFSGFCTDSKDIKAVATVHANCCRSINAKVTDLRAVLRDWKRFKAVSRHPRVVAKKMTVPFRWSPHIGCYNSWNPNNSRTRN